jgi:hypothetical protein
MATVAVELPADEAAAVHDMLDRLARMLKADGDDRPIGQLRARMFADLCLRPWDTSRPSVTAQLHVWAVLSALAGTSVEPGEVNGLAITAGHVRDLLRQLEALGVRPSEGGSVTVGVTDDDGGLLATATLQELRRLARRGCPHHPDTVPDAACSCPVLRRPAAVGRYTPSAAQDRFVRTRDRACRFPNCGQRVGWADLDHVIPHACDGPTDCANLCCLCRSHHRLKTFARGWRFAMSDDGVLTVTTPSGVTRTTRPPAMRPPRAADPPPEPPATGPQPGEPGSGDDRPAPATRSPGILDLIKRAGQPKPRDPGTPDDRPDDDPAPF